MQTVVKKRLSSFHVRLRQLRNEVALTQREVASRLGVGYQTYMRWERGETEPTFTELCEIAAMFGKTPNDFMPQDE